MPQRVFLHWAILAIAIVGAPSRGHSQELLRGPSKPVSPLTRDDALGGIEWTHFERSFDLAEQRVVTYVAKRTSVALPQCLKIKMAGPDDNLFSVIYEVDVEVFRRDGTQQVSTIVVVGDGLKRVLRPLPLLFDPPVERRSGDSDPAMRFSEDLFAAIVSHPGGEVRTSTGARRLSCRVEGPSIQIRVDSLEATVPPSTHDVNEIQEGWAAPFPDGAPLRTEGGERRFPSGCWIRADFIRREGGTTEVQGEVRASNGVAVGYGVLRIPK